MSCFFIQSGNALMSTLPPFDLAPMRPWWVWFDALGMEPLAVPVVEVTPMLASQLEKEGVTPRCVLARSTLQALDLGFPKVQAAPLARPAFRIH
jgi:hypothetical protein